MRTNGSHFSGSASSGKMASTGHSGSQAPQSMHSSGSMTSILSPWWMQSTGQTSTQDRSLMSMQGSAMMYVTRASLRDELVDQLCRSLGQRGANDDPVQTGRLGRTEARGVGVVREAEDGHVRIGLGHLIGLDARDVADHEVGRVDAVGRDELVVGAQERIELSPEEEIDPNQQDRRHARSLPPSFRGEKGLGSVFS